MKIRICKFRINEPGTGKEEWEVLLTNLDYFFNLDYMIKTGNNNPKLVFELFLANL